MIKQGSTPQKNLEYLSCYYAAPLKNSFEKNLCCLDLQQNIPKSSGSLNLKDFSV